MTESDLAVFKEFLCASIGLVHMTSYPPIEPGRILCSIAEDQLPWLSRVVEKASAQDLENETPPSKLAGLGD